MRPLSQGPSLVSKDIIHLSRCLRRVREDPKRYNDNEREDLIRCLGRAIAILAMSERADIPLREIA